MKNYFFLDTYGRFHLGFEKPRLPAPIPKETCDKVWKCNKNNGSLAILVNTKPPSCCDILLPCLTRLIRKKNKKEEEQANEEILYEAIGNCIY